MDSRLTYRQLSAEEIPRECSQDVAVPEGSLIVAGFDNEGKIAAVLSLMTLVHLECFWVRKDLRKEKLGIGRELWGHLKTFVTGLGLQYVFAFAPTKGVAESVKGIGGEKLPYEVYRVRS